MDENVKLTKEKGGEVEGEGLGRGRVVYEANHERKKKPGI
jgi:hypothetical protein